MAEHENLVDAVVIGAGFSGLYATYRLRESGLNVRAFDAADDVGGVWNWNRYPGARTDSLHSTYCFSFDKDLLNEWSYSEVNPAQPEVLAYFNHVADRFNLRDNYTFNTRVTSAVFNENTGRWDIETDGGESLSAKYFVTGLGLVSAPLKPTAPGLSKFKGELYHTAEWPRHEVDFAGKRVAVIGTGSSGVQIVAEIAKKVGHLTVFQRTANWVGASANRPVTDAERAELRENPELIWDRVRQHPAGWPWENVTQSAVETDPQERERIYEEKWNEGGFSLLYNAFADTSTSQEANDLVCEFFSRKIASLVDDPETAKKLTPNHAYGAKRPPTQSGYYEAFNQPNVDLVDLRATPMTEFTEKGIATTEGEFEFDMIIMATGFDAITGAFTPMDIRGVDGLDLSEYWGNGPVTMLGLTVPGFPNMFMVAGPQTPFANLPPGAQFQGDWINDAIVWMRENNIEFMAPTEEGAKNWTQVCEDIADSLPSTRDAAAANSWFTGANVEGKTVAYNIYFGGNGSHCDLCDEEAESNYPNFVKTSDVNDFKKVLSVQ